MLYGLIDYRQSKFQKIFDFAKERSLSGAKIQNEKNLSYTIYIGIILLFAISKKS